LLDGTQRGGVKKKERAASENKLKKGGDKRELKNC